MILIDMDGVLTSLWDAVLRCNGCDVDEVMRTWPPGEYSFAKALGRPAEEIWANVHAVGYDFWTLMKPLPFAEDLVDLAFSLGTEVRVCTKPTDSYFSAAGKRIWLQKHFGGRLGSAEMQHVTGAKHDLARPGRLLVDDCDENCAAWEAAGGEVLLFPQPWNAGHRHNFTDAGRWLNVKLAIQEWHFMQLAEQAGPLLPLVPQYGASPLQPAYRALMQLQEIEKSVGRVISDVKALGVTG